MPSFLASDNGLLTDHLRPLFDLPVATSDLANLVERDVFDGTDDRLERLQLPFDEHHVRNGMHPCRQAFGAHQQR